MRTNQPLATCNEQTTLVGVYRGRGFIVINVVYGSFGAHFYRPPNANARNNLHTNLFYHFSVISSWRGNRSLFYSSKHPSPDRRGDLDFFFHPSNKQKTANQLYTNMFSHFSVISPGAVHVLLGKRIHPYFRPFTNICCETQRMFTRWLKKNPKRLQTDEVFGRLII